ncbi:protein jagged-1 [Galendromus occidentalis]|uniref:Delta-like protein n=1 Tax=Galendromus occidentalis TaxID=34638 RepID=A0AAJ7L708_9ACAR|nr:protein jagged-1 [Galendromus occidentalis]
MHKCTRILSRLCLLSTLIVFATASRDQTSVFEVLITDLSHLNPTIYNGTCCEGSADRYGKCPINSLCNTYFRVCLQEFRRNATPEYRNCTLGETTSDVFRGFGSKTNRIDQQVALSVPIYHRWTETFTLVLDVLHRDRDVTDRRNDPLIDRVSYKANITSSLEFQGVDSRHGKGVYDTATVIYKIRVRCAENHFTKDCSKICYPRDDKYGHWSCDENGEKKCLDGWTDHHCERPVCEFCDADRSVCEAPGRCSCRPGWTGRNCSVCVPYPNCKHGSCAPGKPFTCECERNWGGALCDQDLDVCGRSQPCKNNGVCRNTNPDQYQCSCPDGFFGRNCELDGEMIKYYKPCVRGDGQPVCQNGGSCSEINNGTDFKCDCLPGWLGETCSNDISGRASCASNPCLNGGRCSPNSRGEAVCKCPRGWTGHNCQFDIDECAELEPCLHGSVCTNRMGSYSCTCAAGWEGTNCSLPADTCHQYRCLNGGTCFSNRGGWHCRCPEGFAGKQCEIKADPCQPDPCNGGTCAVLASGKHRCSACPENRFGRNCELTANGLRPQTKLEYDECVVAVSQPSSGRAEFIKTRVCGAHGRCVSSTDANKNPGEFACVCDAGYTGAACHININDCESSPCANGATCLDRVDDYSCVCRPGFTGERCEEMIDACTSSPCHRGECTAIEDDFICRCPQGFKGRHCNLTTSHCDENTCANGGTCQELGSSFVCVCPPDYIGHRCQRKRHLACESTPCKNGATCVNLENDEYQCWCPEGFTGPLCEHNVDDCLEATCFHNATCIDGINRFQCECLPGYSGADCRLDIDECASNPCHGGGTCKDLVNDYRCVCPPSRRGRNCEIMVVKPSPSACFYAKRKHLVGEVWSERHECSTCKCFEGSQVICERGLCELDECDSKDPYNSCPKAEEQCYSTANEPCFIPPCKPHAECRPTPNLKHIRPMSFTDRCGPEDISGCAARIALDFVPSADVTGFTVEAICAHVRRVLSSQPAPDLLVGCVAKSHREIEILVDSAQNDEQLVAALQADRLARTIKEGRTNSSILNAVHKVLVSEASQFKDLSESQKTVTAFLIATAVLVLLLLVAVLVCSYKIFSQKSPDSNIIMTKPYLRDAPSNLNNLRLPKMNNLGQEADVGSSRGKILNTMVNQEMKDFAFKASMNKVSKAVDIPQVPQERDCMDLRYEGCPKKSKRNATDGENSLGEVVWC